MEVSGQLHDPAALPHAKEHWYPLDRSLSRLQSRSGQGGEEKIPSPCWDLNPSSQFKLKSNESTMTSETGSLKVQHWHIYSLHNHNDLKQTNQLVHK